MRRDDDCPLCVAVAIATREPLTNERGAELRGEHCVAVRPLDPISVGHLLVVPLSHDRFTWQYATHVVADCALLQRRLARDAIETGAHGVNLLHASGRAAGQSVPHAHWHVVPRLRDDGLDLWLRRPSEAAVTRRARAAQFEHAAWLARLIRGSDDLGDRDRYARELAELIGTLGEPT